MTDHKAGAERHFLLTRTDQAKLVGAAKRTLRQQKEGYRKWYRSRPDLRDARNQQIEQVEQIIDALDRALTQARKELQELQKQVEQTP